MKFKITIYFFLLILLISCQKKSTLNHELYMGTYRILDQTIPYPYLIEKRQDMVFWYDHYGVKLDSTIHKGVLSTEDTIAMNEFPFKIIYKDNTKINIYPLNDTTHFPISEKGQIFWKNRASFVKITEGDDLQKEDILDQLKGNSYSSPSIAYNPNHHLKVSKTQSFTADSLTTTMTYQYENETVWKETHTHKYKLFDINGKVFISTTVDISNPQNFYQITQANKNSVTIKYYINEYEQTETYQKTKSYMDNKAIHYANCFEGHQGEYYYQSNAQTDVTYKKGNEYLIKKISQNAPPDKGEGYIIVHFNVNCRGQVGRPGLQQMDKQYKPSKFSLPLIKHILTQVSQLDEWPATETSYDFIFYKDVHAFLMFKIENGKIIDLCP